MPLTLTPAKGVLPKRNTLETAFVRVREAALKGDKLAATIIATLTLAAGEGTREVNASRSFAATVIAFHLSNSAPVPD